MGRRDVLLSSAAVRASSSFNWGSSYDGSCGPPPGLSSLGSATGEALAAALRSGSVADLSAAGSAPQAPPADRAAAAGSLRSASLAAPSAAAVRLRGGGRSPRHDLRGRSWGGFGSPMEGDESGPAAGDQATGFANAAALERGHTAAEAAAQIVHSSALCNGWCLHLPAPPQVKRQTTRYACACVTAPHTHHITRVNVGLRASI